MQKKNKGRKISILLVDYDQHFLEVSKKCLSLHCSFDIETASSNQEAYSKLKQIEPNVIVCDLFKSNTNCFSFLKSLRDKGNNTPFILFTFEDEKELVDDAFQLGANGYVWKYGDPAVVYPTLKNCIVSVLGRLEERVGDEFEA